MFYPSHSPCVQSDLKGLTEIYIIDTDFTSLCGLDLHATSSVIPGASMSQQEPFSVWPARDSVCNNF